MAEGLHLTVLTPERAVLEMDVYSLVAPGAGGYLGVMKNHAPLITTLIPGKLTVKDPSGAPTVYAVGGGFMEISNNRVTILADSMESAAEIDLTQATEERDRAQARLRDNLPAGDREEAEAELARAQNRIRVKRDPSPSV